jgi:cytochrome c
MNNLRKLFACSALMLGVVLHPAASANDTALIDKGKSQFIRCVSCHSMTPGARLMQGPHLQGIVGRKVASIEGHAYSDELRAQDFVWTDEKLDEWLQQPQSLARDMCMPFMGLANPEMRRALIAYLKNPAS